MSSGATSTTRAALSKQQTAKSPSEYRWLLVDKTQSRRRALTDRFFNNVLWSSTVSSLFFFRLYRSWSVRSGWISMDVSFHCNVNVVAVIVYCIRLGSRFSRTWIQLVPRGPSTHAVTLTHGCFLSRYPWLFIKNKHVPPIKSNSFTVTLPECKVRLLKCNSVI